ncbi:MAG: tryptophan synthase subunit alpha [Actinomycetes bacterium]
MNVTPMVSVAVPGLDDHDLAVPDAPAALGVVEGTLRSARSQGRKLIVPYVTGGFGTDWLDVVRSVAHAGADAIEIGIPFSDPVMDGPIIQAASEQALRSGVTPGQLLAELSSIDVGVPLIVMTYYNIVFRAGLERFAQTMAASGISGAILPDVPLEEIGPWARQADQAAVETILLAAPTASDGRLERVCRRARGFVYAVGLLGVTGERATLAATSLVIARRLKDMTDKPVLVGVGVSTPQQAVEVCEQADGVVIGSALMRRVLDGEGPHGAETFIASVRKALDAG